MAKTAEERWAYLLPELQSRKIVLLSHPNIKNLAPHSHLFFELSYVTEGSAEHIVDGKTSVLHRGDYFFIDYGSIHGYKAHTGNSFANFDCVFLPEILDPSLKGTENLKDLFHHYSVNFNLEFSAQNLTQMTFHDDDGTILALMMKMKRESTEKPPLYSELIRCYFIEIILLTLRRMDSASIAASANSVSSFLTSYVAKHYAEEISLSALASELNYSLPYVSKRFKEETGVGFVKFLQSHRIRAACRMLLTNNKSIPEIAELVGYHDVKFFTEQFKRHTGFTPLSYRKTK